jgi:hypothetical protein
LTGISTTAGRAAEAEEKGKSDRFVSNVDLLLTIIAAPQM